MYIAPGQGLKSPWGRNFDVNTSVGCCKFQKKISLKSDFIQYMYIAPGQGQTAPGDTILMSTERPYHFTHLLQVSKKSL